MTDDGREEREGTAAFVENSFFAIFRTGLLSVPRTRILVAIKRDLFLD